MARRKRSILNDARWQRMALRYRNNRVKFAVEVMGVQPSWQQRQILEAMDQPGARVSVASGHGTGKSFIAGTLAMHTMLCHVKPEMILTANNIDQVRRVIFKYVTDSWQVVCKRFPWLRQYFTVTSELFYCNEFRKSWYVAGKTVPKDKPEGIAGAHNKNLIFLVDEASGVDDKVLSVIRGALSEENNKLLMFSQPTRNAGHFYDSHHSLKKADPLDPDEAGYIAFTLNSEESPFVSVKSLREYAKSYGGYDSPEYQIKVRGEFSDQLEGYLITRLAAQRAQLVEIEHGSAWGYIIVADVGGGVERDSSVMGIFKVSGITQEERCIAPVEVREMPKTMTPKEFGRELARTADYYPNAVLAIDSIGVGLTTAQEAEELGANVQRIVWGVPCHAQAHKRRFGNQRAMAYVTLKEAIMEGRVRLDGSDKVVEQISRIPYKINEKGQYMMRTKDEMRSAGIKSPDWADVYAMAMLADMIPADALPPEQGSAEGDYLAELAKLVDGHIASHAICSYRAGAPINRGVTRWLISGAMPKQNNRSMAPKTPFSSTPALPRRPLTSGKPPSRRRACRPWSAWLKPPRGTPDSRITAGGSSLPSTMPRSGPWS